MKYFSFFFFLIIALTGTKTALAVTGTSGAGFLSSNIVGEIDNNVEALAGKSGYDKNMEVGDVVAAFINGFLALLGVIFVILIILAGYNWMTASGDEEKVTKAKDTIKRAIIGLMIIIAAYSITYFVFQNLPD